MAAEIRDVVSIVVGSAAQPPWLEERIRQMARMIASFREGEDRAPRRADARKRFECFRDAVLLVREELTDPDFEVYFRQFWTTSEVSYNPALRTLESLGNKAGALSMELSGRGGAARAYPTEPENSISARELCAWVIVQALQKTRTITSIGPDNVDAQEAANLLWQVCGGDPLGSAEDGRPPTGWRSYILSVKEAERAGDQRSAWLASMAETFEALVLGRVVI